MLSNLNPDGSVRNQLVHGSGHLNKTVTSGTAAFLVCIIILLALATLYLVLRVYKLNKYFHKDWIAEYGDSNDVKPIKASDKQD
jgi:hypothetical protein